MRALVRLDAIDGGEVLWKGKPICGDAIPAFRKQLAYLQQRPALIEGSVEGNLRLPFTLRVNQGQEFSKEAALALLDQAGRPESFLERSSTELSGGEAQIVALVRTLQLKPTVLLLDEPTASLDEESTTKIEGLVTRWFEESPSDRAFLWISHSKDQMERMGSRTLTMSGGRLAS